MRKRTVIILDKDDRANLREFRDAAGLLGYTAMSEEKKLVFGRIVGNSGFTIGDLEAVQRFAREKAAEVQALKPSDCPFPEMRPGMHQEWLDGLRGNVSRALDMLDGFVDDIRMDFVTASEDWEPPVPRKERRS